MPDARFDAAISSFGVVLFPDPAAGMAELHRVLRPGGRVAIVTWTEPHRYALAARLYQAIIAVRGAPLPDGELPAQLRFVEPERLRALVADAGFAEISIVPLAAELHASSAKELAASLKFAPGMQALLDSLGPDRPAVLRELREWLLEDQGPGPARLGAIAQAALPCGATRGPKATHRTPEAQRMNRRTLLAAVTARRAVAQPAKWLVFAAIPDQNEMRLVERFGRVATYLETTLGVHVGCVPVKSYPTAVTALTNDQVQLAWFGGFTGVQARRAVPGSEAIAQGVEDTAFTSYFIANAATGLTRGETLPPGRGSSLPAGIAGRSFSFGARASTSTSGRVMPEFDIRKQFGQASVVHKTIVGAGALGVVGDCRSTDPGSRKPGVPFKLNQD